MNKPRTYILLFFIASSAQVVYAQQTFRTFVSTIIDLIQAIIPVVMAFAFAFFLWQGAKLVLTASNDKSESKQGLFWSLVALFVMVALWGIVELIKVTFLP
jgi:zinc transporter ZupT